MPATPYQFKPAQAQPAMQVPLLDLKPSTVPWRAQFSIKMRTTFCQEALG